MIRSMTSFGRVEETCQWGHVVWEVRSVNHRYLEVNPRLPEELRSLDSQIRQRIQSRLKRGKIDCNLRFDANQSEVRKILLNQELIKQVMTAISQIQENINKPADLSAIDILKWPGVIEQEQIDLDSLAKDVLNLLEKCLDAVIETRASEGQRIHQMIDERCKRCQEIVVDVRSHIPELMEHLRKKLQQRVAELCNELDHDRLEQEIVLLAQKYDVAEELDRLEAHISEVGNCLQQEQPIGRRLDFLMQEMNREANTLGSKAADIQYTNASVDLKVLIEQMREQIQNIE